MGIFTTMQDEWDEEEDLLDREHGLDDLPGYLIAIETACNDLSLLIQAQQIVTESFSDPAVSLRNKRFQHVMLRTVRDKIATRYSFDISEPTSKCVLAQETLTLVLEAEENSSKSLIGRMVDALVAAFEWLWKAITGLFGDSEDEEVAEREAKSLVDKLKEASAKNTEAFKVQELDTPFYNGLFDHSPAWSTVNVGVLANAAKTHAEFAQRLMDCLDKISKPISDALKDTNALEANEGANVKEAGGVVARYQPELAAALASTLKDTFQTTHQAYAFMKSYDGVDAQQSYVIEPILATGGTGALGILLKGKKYYAKYAHLPKQGESKGVVKLPPDLAGMLPLGDAVAHLRETLGKLNSKIKASSGRLNADNKGIIDAIKRLKDVKMPEGEEGKAVRHAITELLDFAQSAGKIKTGLLATYRAIQTSRKHLEQVVQDAMKLAKQGSLDGQAAKPEEAPKEGTEAAPAAEAPAKQEEAPKA